MNKLDLDYQNLLKDILENGTTKETRNGGTISVFGRQIRHKMSEGFPLLTTKKMAWKQIVTELLWFLRGDTNIKYLVDNGCHIWDGNAFSNYEKNAVVGDVIDSHYEPATDKWHLYNKEEFINMNNKDERFAKKWGELGPIYGKQWRSWQTYEYEKHTGCLYSSRDINGNYYAIDQIANLINDLKTNPDSRRLMVSAWNVGELDQMVLPPCHYGFQVYTRKLPLDERGRLAKKEGWDGNFKDFDKYDIPTRAISLMWNQRLVDTFLGLPFNIDSYGLLLKIIAKEVNMVPDELIGNLGDVHLYSNHVEQAKEQIGRELSLDERYDLMPLITGHSKENIKQRKLINNFQGNTPGISYHEEWLDSFNIPKRTREPYPLPTLKIEDEVKWNEGDCLPYYSPSNFTLENYQSHPAIKAPLSN